MSGARVAPYDRALIQVRLHKVNPRKVLRTGYQRVQRGYYEHIIRDESELNETRQYILQNPRQWTLDPASRHHPAPVKP